jgi:hypothetical protein
MFCHHKWSTLVAIGLVVFIVTTPVFAVDNEANTKVESQSGYDDIPEFGGPDGVSAELTRNDQKRDSKYAFDISQRVLAPYFNWKRQLNDDHGL